MSFKIKLLIETCFQDCCVVKLLGHSLITLVRALFCLLFLLSPALVASANVPESEVAGHVTLVIGQALAINKNHQQRELKRDDVVYSGETIETSLGGHVHLHFIDDGIVSLRPSSRLIIELYHYDKQQANNSAIRFTLQSGVLRSISGKATEADHQRFRLNTPITAIGVLGTDFIVRAEPEKVWAGVYSGAIAIAPLSDQCIANSLGACAGATRLTELMGGVMLEFTHGKVQEKLVPIDPAILSKSKPSNLDNSDNAIASSSSLLTTTNGTSGRITPIDIVVVDALAQQTPTPPVVTPVAPPVIPPVVQSSPFVWERWFWTIPATGDTMTQASGTHVGANFLNAGNSYAGLFSITPLTQVQPQAGVYDFSLTQGQVYFVGNGYNNFPSTANPGLAQLNSGSLQVNFATQSFNTQLALQYQTVSANLNLTGAIQSSGGFGIQNPAGTSLVSGAISGNHAAMAFMQQVPEGTFTGLTDWVKK